MFQRIASLILLVWMLGFIWFAIALPQPQYGAKTDGVAVLTGGPGRIARSLEVLDKGWSRKLLVSGVDEHVRPVEFQASYKVPAEQIKCCVTLGFESWDTQSNARETARWIADNKLRSVRLVTTDWHMRRAAYELERMLPDGVSLVRDAVVSKPSLKVLFIEYHKLLARRAAVLWGG